LSRKRDRETPCGDAHGQVVRGVARAGGAGIGISASYTPSARGGSHRGVGRGALAIVPAAFENHPFNLITARHLDRLLGGELLVAGARLDWARLLRRT
jgi:hypothetical protein